MFDVRLFAHLLTEMIRSSARERHIIHVIHVIQNIGNYDRNAYAYFSNASNGNNSNASNGNKTGEEIDVVQFTATKKCNSYAYFSKCLVCDRGTHDAVPK